MLIIPSSWGFPTGHVRHQCTNSEIECLVSFVDKLVCIMDGKIHIAWLYHGHENSGHVSQSGYRTWLDPEAENQKIILCLAELPACRHIRHGC
jgi:hypothetical protein